MTDATRVEQTIKTWAAIGFVLEGLREHGFIVAEQRIVPLIDPDNHVQARTAVAGFIATMIDVRDEMQLNHPAAVNADHGTLTATLMDFHALLDL